MKEITNLSECGLIVALFLRGSRNKVCPGVSRYFTLLVPTFLNRKYGYSKL